jgi:chaperonin GroEL (HSP60 family)
VDDIGDVKVNNDGEKIIRMIEVEKNEERVLVEMEKIKDEEVGDGNN